MMSSRPAPRGRQPGHEAGSVTDPAFAVLPPAGPELPWVIHIPHAATRIPEPRSALLRLGPEEVARELLMMTDAHVDQIFAPARDLGATVFLNLVSRLVADPERFPADQDEPAARRGQGAVYTHTHDGRPLRPAGWGALDRERLMSRYFRPYAESLERLVRHHLDRHGACWILDAHSFPSRPHPYEDPGKARPAICLGYEPGQAPRDWIGWWESLADGLIPDLEPARAAMAATGLPLLAHNEPYGGSYVPQSLIGDPRVRSMMIEVNRSLYMDEGTGTSYLELAPAHRGDETQALLRVVGAFLEHAAGGIEWGLGMA